MRHARAAARHALQTLHGLWLTVRYPVSSRGRFLVTAWTVGLIVVGNASAHAADGFIVGPQLGGSGQTLFEKYDPSAYTVYVDTDSDHSGLGTSQLWDFVNAITNMVLWLGLTALRGALVAVQWFLHMDLYHDQTGAIDAASSSLNAAVFLPLLGITLPIAGFAVYSRAKQSGGGSIGNDLAWMVATVLLAMTIVAQPSKVLGYADTARTAIATHVMSGYSNAAGQQQSATGYANPKPDGTQSGAIRQITDGLWEVYGVNSWCYIAWKSLDTCKIEAQSYLDDPSGQNADSPWGKAKARMADDGDFDPFGKDTGWVRGQEAGRLGAAVLFLLDELVAAVCLLVFVFFGLMSLIGVIILIFLGAVILPAWPIPGVMRSWGNRWLESTLGTFLQSLLITTLIGAVMVVSAIFAQAVPTYGIFMVAMFNLVALGLGLRYRAQLEHLIGFGTGATGGSAMTSYMAARTLGKLSRMGGRAVGGAARTGATVGAGFGRSTVGASRTIAGAAGRAGTHVAQRGYAAYQARLAPLTVGAGGSGKGAPPAPSAPPIPAPAPTVAAPRMPAPASRRTPPPPPPTPPVPVHAPAAPRLATPAASRPTPPPPPPAAAPGAPRAAQPARMATPPRATRPTPPPAAPGAPAAKPTPGPTSRYYSMKPLGGNPK